MTRSWFSRSAGPLLLIALVTGPAWSEAETSEEVGIGLPFGRGLIASAAALPVLPDRALADGLPLKLTRELHSVAARASQIPAQSPTLLEILAVILLFLAANIVLLLLFSIGVRFSREFGRRRRDRFCARWEPVLHARMSGDVAPLPTLARSERLLFLSLWLHQLGYVRDQAADALVQTAQELGLPQYALRLLESGSAWKRLIAMRAVAALRLPQACGALLARMTHGRPRSSLAAARALLQIDPKPGFAGLEHLLNRWQWTPGAMVEVVRAGGSHTVEKLAALVRSAPPGRAKQLVRLIELLEDQTALPALRERLVSSRDEEEIAAILHFLGKFGRNEDRAITLAFLDHGNWLIRMQAAYALGTFGLAQDINQLAPLLRDRHWWVRYRSAQSLLRLAGTAAVAIMRESEPDPYARDMLERVLAEGR